MLKLGIAINETWSFFREIYDYLSEYHQTTLFEPHKVYSPIFRERINRVVYQNQLQSFLKSQDVVFFEWASELLMQASQLPKTAKIVTRLHRYEMYQWADKIQWASIDRVILVSRAKEREFRARFPDHASKVIVIPEAIALQRFEPKFKPFNGDIGILCHLSPRKRVYELVLTFAEMRRQRQDLHLHIGGGQHPKFGDYYEALHSLTKKLGLDNHITFYGPVADPQNWYHKVDVFISNSYSEGLQVSPMEAIASGCYCLSHDWDGADELLPTHNIYRTDSELIDKLFQYCDLSQTEKQHQQAQLRNRVIECFNLDQIKGEIRQVIELTAQGKS